VGGFLATRHLTPTDPRQERRQSPRLSPDGREIAYWMIEGERIDETSGPGRAVGGRQPSPAVTGRCGVHELSLVVRQMASGWPVGIKRGKDMHVGVRLKRTAGPVEQIHKMRPNSAVRSSWSPRRATRFAFAGTKRDGCLECVGRSLTAATRRQPAIDTFSSRRATAYDLPRRGRPTGRRIAFQPEHPPEGSMWTVQVSVDELIGCASEAAARRSS